MAKLVTQMSGRPTLPPGEKVIGKTICLPPEFWLRIAAESAITKKNRSEIMREALVVRYKDDEK